MKTILSILFIWIPYFLLHGQDAYQLSWDNNLEYLGVVALKDQVKDNVGEYCALLKIDIPIESIDIRGDLVMNKPFKEGESWYVYVSTFSKDKSVIVYAERYYPISIPLMTNDGQKLEGNAAYQIRISPPNDVNAQKAWITFTSEKKSFFVVKIHGDEYVSEDGKVMINLFYGKYEYEIEGDINSQGKFDLTGPPITINVDGEESPIGYGTLMVNYNPVGARVYLDGNLLGKSPNVFNKIAAGKHVLQVEYEGYRIKTDSIIIIKGEKIFVEGKLLKQDGMIQSLTPNDGSSRQSSSGVLSVDYAPEGATVYFDNKYLGISPGVFSNIDIGRHELRIEHDGYLMEKRNVIVKSSEQTKVQGSLRRKVKIKEWMRYNSSQSTKSTRYRNNRSNIKRTR